MKRIQYSVQISRSIINHIAVFVLELCVDPKDEIRKQHTGGCVLVQQKGQSQK